jgi:hypothetical protein
MLGASYALYLQKHWVHTRAHRLQVQESWAIVAQDLDTHGIKFFLRIFEIAPPALQLFSFKGTFTLNISFKRCIDVCCATCERVTVVTTSRTCVCRFSRCSDDADLASSPAMKKHAASVMNTVGAAVIRAHTHTYTQTQTRTIVTLAQI